MIPEHSLRLVNKEASEIVRDAYKGLEDTPRGGQALARNQKQITVSYRQDMLFLIGGDTQAYIHTIYLLRCLDPRRNIDIHYGLRHLALRLFDIAEWPNAQDLSMGTATWFGWGLVPLLQSATQLETFYIVVDRVFSGATFDPDDDASATATDTDTVEQSRQLVHSPSELLQMVKSLPRDRYGFTDYNTFAAKTKLDILPPEFCSPPPHCKSVMMDFQGMMQ
ncbi:hypothetical protein PG988_006465 [Apiospora saccharicola]